MVAKEYRNLYFKLRVAFDFKLLFNSGYEIADLFLMQ